VFGDFVGFLVFSGVFLWVFVGCDVFVFMFVIEVGAALPYLLGRLAACIPRLAACTPI
jgi:hypothetical protein